MFTFLLTVAIVCDGRIRCGQRLYSNCLTILFFNWLCIILFRNLGIFLFLQLTSVGILLFRGALFIQNSSLLYTPSSKFLFLCCLNRFLQGIVLFIKQNTTVSKIAIVGFASLAHKRLGYRCAAPHTVLSKESVIVRLRHFPSHLGAYCTSTPFTFLFPVRQQKNKWLSLGAVQQCLIKVFAVVTIPSKETFGSDAWHECLCRNQF